MVNARSIRQAVLLLLVGGLLAGVFALYADPHFLVLLANQVWACF